MSPQSRPAVPSTVVSARDAGLRRLHQLTVGAAILGAAGTVALGGASAVTFAGRATPTGTLVGQTGSASASGAGPAAGGTGSPGGIGAGSTSTADGEQRPHSPSPVPADQLPPRTTTVAPGIPGSGLVTSGGS